MSKIWGLSSPSPPQNPPMLLLYQKASDAACYLNLAFYPNNLFNVVSRVLLLQPGKAKSKVLQSVTDTISLKQIFRKS
jgi:hypothetical protein